MWHWMADAIVALGLLVLGFMIGGTIAWYRGWDEGFREGYNKDIEENAPRRNPAAPKSGNRQDAGRRDFGARKAS